MGQTIGNCPFDSYYRSNLINNTDGVEVEISDPLVV